MADQIQPTPAPAPKRSANLGQQLQTDEQQAPDVKYNPYTADALKIDPAPPSFKSEDLGVAERERDEQIKTQAEGISDKEEDEEEESPETNEELSESEEKPKAEQFLTGAGGSVDKESLRAQLLREQIEQRVNQAEEESQADQERQIAAKKTLALPNPAQRATDRGIDFMIIGLMGIKDLIDSGLGGFDLGTVGALTAPFFITIAMVLRGMQKSRTDKKFTMFIGIILFCEAVPLLALIPSSVILFFVLRFEDATTAILQKIPGQLKSGK